MSSNIETISALYQAFQEGDIPAILQRLAPDCEWEYETFDYGIPWLIPRRGPAEVALFFEGLGGIEFHRFEVQNLLAGGDQVAAVLLIEATVRATGKKVRDIEVHLFTFNASGQIQRFRHVLDTLQHQGAATA